MKNFFLVYLLLVCISCSKEQTEQLLEDTINDSPWINVEKPYPTGENGLFPLIKSPKFKAVNSFTNLSDDDKVALVSFNGEVKVYPYLYVNRSEIVNDHIDTFYYAISYCPQTKSAINYNRIVQNDTLDLVASGYLYKDNMVPSDKNFEMYWSQMLMKGITNNATSKNIKTYNTIETTWKTVVEYFSNADVFYYDGPIITPKKTINTSSQKNSSEIQNSDFVFAIVENLNDSGKDEVVHAYALNSFSNTTDFTDLIIDGKRSILIANKQQHFFSSFYTPNGLTFQLTNNNFPPTLKDNEGTKWNAFGYAFEGPRKGTQLESTKSYVASWWAWKDFFKSIEIK